MPKQPLINILCAGEDSAEHSGPLNDSRTRAAPRYSFTAAQGALKVSATAGFVIFPL